uniref:Uncharacterized protein n=1 Tax=Rhizophora mucronata TaxID=61149 RepID=A0A2P2NTE1_RHIMU
MNKDSFLGNAIHTDRHYKPNYTKFSHAVNLAMAY